MEGGQSQMLGEQLRGETTATSRWQRMAVWTQLVERELWRRRWVLGVV